MSAAVSATPEAVLGAFRNVTPGGVPTRPADGNWSAAVLDGVFYLATATPENRSVLRLAPGSGKWETVYAKNQPRSKADREFPDAALPEILLVSSASKDGNALFLKIADGETECLRSDTSGGAFEIVPPHFEDVKAAFAQVEKPAWDSFKLPEHPVTSEPSALASFAGKTAVAFDDETLGASVWIAAAGASDWNAVIVRGAHRFSLNANVIAAVPWQDSLVLALGSTKATGVGKPPIGFELVRLYPDGSWDLLIGTPRISNKGLKVPLACLGPGMNDFEPARFCFLTAGEDHLLLGTFDDIAGFRLWRSDEGIAWTAGEAELVGVDRVRRAQAYRIAGGTTLILDLEGPQHGAIRSVWVGK